MQTARFKLHAEERTCNPVQRPNFRGQGTKKEPQKTIRHRSGKTILGGTSASTCLGA
jgi:hypothetical protein